MKKYTAFILALALLLCGCGAARSEGEGFTPEYPTLSPTEPEDPQAILDYRRDVVEQAMREQSAILWTPTEDITYSMRGNSQGVEADSEEYPDDVVTLEAGKVYQGIPYTHGSGSYYSWLAYAVAQDEHGIYTLSGITDQHLTGKSAYKENNCARLGNDCADQLFWAWGRISSTIQFSGTATMTDFYGCLKVGDYDCVGTTFDAANNTKVIVKENGEQRMFAAYGCLQKGDAMVLVNQYNEGHAVMVVTGETVYNTDGTINGDASYVTVLEQTTGCERSWDCHYDNQLKKWVYPCEIMDKKWSYNTLFKKGYLPVTCKELVDPAPLAPPVITDYTDVPTVDNMFGGVVECNYRFSSITVTVTKDGKALQKVTCFGHQNEMFAFNLFRFTKEAEEPVMLGSLDLDALESGSYHCTFDARISTGQVIRFRDFDFSK